MKAYKVIGVFVGLLVYAGCIIAGGPIGFLFGWVPAIILGFIWPLPVGAIGLVGVGFAIMEMISH